MDYIAYYRVSTKRQGSSGLGLDAQKELVAKHAGNCIGEFIEIQSGKKAKNNPQLARALSAAKEAGATLIIARLDRLSRNAAFVFTLIDSGVPFICANMTSASNLSIRILAVFAQEEGERISANTKAALAVLKARGIKLGTPANLTDYSREQSIIARRANAAEKLKAPAEIARVLHGGNYTLGEIAIKLDSMKFKTSRGCKFTPTAVRRLLLSNYADV